MPPTTTKPAPIRKRNFLSMDDATMDMQDMQTVLQYLMSRLSEEELSELDDMLVPQRGTDPSAAMDARRAPFGNKMSAWIKKGPAGRIQARDAQTAKLAAAAKSTAEFHERFPHAARLMR